MISLGWVDERRFGGRECQGRKVIYGGGQLAPSGSNLSALVWSAYLRPCGGVECLSFTMLNVDIIRYSWHHLARTYLLWFGVLMIVPWVYV